MANKKGKQIVQTPAEKKPNGAEVKSASSFSIPTWLGLTLLSILGTVIYANSLDCAFQLDDFQSIVNNAGIRNLGEVSAWWNIVPTRALGYGSFALTYHWAEYDLFYWHLTNLMIHLVNAILVWALSLQIFALPKLHGTAVARDRQLLAFSIALLFVSHPLATGSVTYLVQRLAALVSTFYLLSVLLYLKGRSSNGNSLTRALFFVGAGFAALAAFWTKENAFTLPLIILLLEVYFLQSRPLSFTFGDYRFVGLLGVCAAVVVLLLFKFPHSIFKPIAPDLVNNFTEITPVNYLLTQFSVIVKYIQMLLVPIHQNVDYDFPVANSLFDTRTFICLALLLALVGVALKLYRSHLLLSFGIFWFLMTLSVESSIIPISDVIFEHRTYLPSFGFFLVLVVAAHQYLGANKRVALVALFVGLIGVYSLLTINRNKVWKTPLTLWSDVIEKSPDKARGYNNRGIMYNEAKKYDLALSDFNKAIALQPKYATAFYNRGIAYQNIQNTQAAFQDFEQALKMDSTHVEAFNSRGLLHQAAQRFPQALADYDKAIQLQPTYFKGYFNRGILFGVLNRLNEAMLDFDKAIALNPNLGDTYYNRAVVTFNQGNKEKACNDWQIAYKKGYAQAKGMLDQYCK